MSLFNLMVSPERDRLARPPIDEWVATLDHRFSQFIAREPYTEYAELEILANQVSLILFYLSEVEKSKKLCFLAQRFFFEQYTCKPTYSNSNKFGVIQPWINLVRIDRFLGKIHTAFKKVEYLNPCNPSATYSLGQCKIKKDTLPKESIRLMANCYIDEKAKLLLVERAFRKMNQFIIDVANTIPLSEAQTLFLLEMRLIVMFYLEKNCAMIPDFIAHSTEALQKKEKIFFLLKLVHFYLETGDIAMATQEVDKLIAQSALEDNPPLYILRFWLNVARTIEKLPAYKMLNDLLKVLYHAFEQHNDALSCWEIACMLERRGVSDNKLHALSTHSTYAIIARKGSKEYLWHGSCLNLYERIIQYMKNSLIKEAKLREHYV